MTGARSRVRPVDPEMVRTLVRERGEIVRDLPDGAAGSHHEHPYQVVLEGSNLVVRTRWSRTLPAGARRSAAQLVNDWNRDRVLPTLHTEPAEDGLVVVAVSATSVAVGLSLDQAGEVVDVALTVTAHALRALAASVPGSPDVPGV